MSLKVENLSFRYGKRDILRNISFEAGSGVVLGLLGPNGTGKTTLLKCISKILTPLHGECYVNNEKIYHLTAQQRAKLVAYVPQSVSNIFPIRVIDAVMMGRMPFVRFNPKEKDKEFVFSILKRLELEEFAFQNVNELSGGERQRVWIARSIAQQPKLLLLDEPTSSLDLKNQKHTLQMIRQLAEQERLTVVISIHDLNLAAMFCDQFLMVKNCGLFAFGKEDAVITQENVREVYGVDTDIRQINGHNHVILV